MNTLLLDQSSWDLILDANGNIAMASDPYSLSQDAASAIKTFLGEVFYDTSIGVPYFQTILGQTPPLTLIKQRLVAAALTVPGVASAQCFISSVQGRALSGQVQISTSAGLTSVASF